MGEDRSLGVGGGESLRLGAGRGNPCGARPKVSTRFSKPGRALVLSLRRVQGK